MFVATNPTTGEELHRYPLHTDNEVAGILERSAAGFADWRKTSFEERAELLKKVARSMRDDEERLAQKCQSGRTMPTYCIYLLIVAIIPVFNP